MKLNFFSIIAVLTSLLTSVLATLALAGPREEQFVLNEQQNNIKHIYKTGVFESQLPFEFSSESGSRFRLPYFLIPLNSPFLRQVSPDAIPQEIKKYHVIESEGTSYFKYPVHPAVLKYHQDKFADQFKFVAAQNSEFIATATASERTLVMVEPFDYSYQIKLNLPLEINHRDRTMYPTEIKRGVWLTSVFSEVFERQRSLKELFFIFKEPYGLYPKVAGESLGGIVFRQYSEEFNAPNREVLPLFSLLAKSPLTGKPLFFDFIGPKQNPWTWFEGKVLNPILEIVDRLTYQEGISLELHSQNVLVEIDTANKGLSGRFGYRDLASTHLDFFTLAAQRRGIPRSDLVFDPQRELGAAYAKKTELEWLHYFFKNQISDLFFIQMAAHGLISREEREEYKTRAWNIIKQHHERHYQGDTRIGFEQAFKSVIENNTRTTPTRGLSCRSLFASGM